MENFKNNIKEWVSIDNQIKRYNEELKSLRSTKQDITQKMYEYANENDLDTSTISISDGRLRFQTTKQIQPLTMQYIEECLEDCIDEPVLIESIMDKIKTSRSYKISNDVKRYTNKNT